MANPEHLAILKQGVKVWNAWREEQHDQPDLSGADLSETELGGVDLFTANLSRAFLRGADLFGADVRFADLQDADLRKANLFGADLTNSCLRRASLREANLCEAKIKRGSIWSVLFEGGVEVDLGGADLSEAMFGGTILSDLDLSTAIGLDVINHQGPSTLGIDTLYRSKGKIPEVFLRGCGVPDDLIGYIKSIAGSIQFYSCFISYSTKDQEFADRLYADLQAKGVRCWFAPHDIRGGRKIYEQIDEAIRQYDKLLLILSEDSMASDWVQSEIAKARKREAQEKRQMLFPVALVPYAAVEDWECFDADRGKDSAREVREYFIPDFSNWKDHDSYQKAFTRLVADLKAESR